MEAERRSTMSSLKGQLSNVEGSVKSMKAAVVVGSVLTVACLAAVFGVTVLANEVSKEVKVSNGTVPSCQSKRYVASEHLQRGQRRQSSCDSHLYYMPPFPFYLVSHLGDKIESEST